MKSEINVDLNLNSKVVKIGFSVLLILVLLIFTWNLRSAPIDLDGTEKLVEQNVFNQFKNVIAQDVNNQYPNLNPIMKQEEIDKRVEKLQQTRKYTSSNGQVLNVDDYVQGSAKGIREKFKAENGQTYLNAIDPYHFYKFSRLYLENGFVGTSLDENGSPLLEYKEAPKGQKGTFSPNFHTFVFYSLFKVFGIDENSTNGEAFVPIFILPIILALLCVIPSFFIIRKYTNDICSFFGTFLLVFLQIKN